MTATTRATKNYARSADADSKPIVTTKTKRGSSGSAKKTMTRKRKLRFTELDIIEFPIALGDNPSVHGGPPISCDWEPQLRFPCSIDLFEQHRPPRRHRKELMVCPAIREKILLQAGVSSNDIAQACVDARKAKVDRYLSVEESNRFLRLYILLKRQKKQQLVEKENVDDSSPPELVDELTATIP